MAERGRGATIAGFKEIGKSKWMKDSAASTCPGCNGSFGFMLRKHHCRSCGQIFCATCVPKCVVTSDPSGVRVCSNCQSALDVPEDRILGGSNRLAKFGQKIQRARLNAKARFGGLKAEPLSPALQAVVTSLAETRGSFVALIKANRSLFASHKGTENPARTFFDADITPAVKARNRLRTALLDQQEKQGSYEKVEQQLGGGPVTDLHAEKLANARRRMQDANLLVERITEELFTQVQAIDARRDAVFKETLDVMHDIVKALKPGWNASNSTIGLKRETVGKPTPKPEPRARTKPIGGNQDDQAEEGKNPFAGDVDASRGAAVSIASSTGGPGGLLDEAEEEDPFKGESRDRGATNLFADLDDDYTIGEGGGKGDLGDLE